MFKNPLPGVPLIESPFFDEAFADSSIDDATRHIAQQLHDKGYAVLDFPDPDFNQVADSICRDLTARFDWDGWKAGSIHLRLQDAYKFDENVRRIATNEKITALLSTLFGRKAWPFQTLNFPVGSQQHYHTDSIHFSSIPERFMCGVWVALEDITEDSGPLVYYPGSHKWPIYTNEHLGVRAHATRAAIELYGEVWRALVARSGIAPETFVPRKGQALIWLSNLLHGGEPHRDKNKTRWSQVTHYYFDECAYYTPMHSDPFLGQIEFREMEDIVSGKKVANVYAGQPMPAKLTRREHPAKSLLRAVRDKTLGRP